MPQPQIGAVNTPPAVADGATPGSARDPFFDNAKLLAMVLVVTGHSWQPLKDSHAIWSGYLFVYLFHMPMFILISGYFSRNFAFTPGQTKRLITGVAVPYAIFETVYSLYGNIVDGRHNDISLLSPWYLTWFLLALFLWRLTAPLWRAMRWYVAVAVALALALIGSATEPGAILNLDRVLQFLPFFVIGLVLRPEHWQLLRRPWVRIAALPVMAGAAVMAYWVKGRMTAEWAMHNHGWSELQVSWPVGAAMTLAMTACSLILTAAFLAWVPRHRTWFTKLGAGTLCAYLLHGFFVRTVAWEGWLAPAFWHTPVGELIVTALGTALALLLTSPPVRTLFRPVMEPGLDWVFRPMKPADPAQPTQTAQTDRPDDPARTPAPYESTTERQRSRQDPVCLVRH